MVDKIIDDKGFDPLVAIIHTGKVNTTGKSGESEKKDRVDFSSALQNTNRGQAVGSAQEVARVKKLQVLKAQIESGTYQPDLEKVASSLLPSIL